MDQDAALAALAAGCVTLALFLFFPGVTEDWPDLVRTGLTYFVALALFGGGFELWRRRWRR